MFRCKNSAWVLGASVLVGLVAACQLARAEVVECESTPTTATSYVPGWFCVDFNLDQGYVDSHRGEFFENYDEYVGYLLDEGLEVEKSMWLKPGYGNENLLWTLNTDLVGDLSVATEADGEAGGDQGSTGTLDIAGVQWRYRGSSAASGEGEKPFRDFVFACGQDRGGVAVFYWGQALPEGVSPVQYGPSGDVYTAVRELLESLNDRCSG